jgi:hypothetical protein
MRESGPNGTNDGRILDKRTPGELIGARGQTGVVRMGKAKIGAHTG